MDTQESKHTTEATESADTARHAVTQYPYVQLTRTKIKQVGCNPDHIGNIADAIAKETRKEKWDTAYITEKLNAIRTILEGYKTRVRAREESALKQLGEINAKKERPLFKEEI